MKIAYDPKKNAANMAKHGVSFEEAHSFNFITATMVADNRRDYGETRMLATGYLGYRLHVLCFTWMKSGVRVISFRKANARERKKYEKEKTTIH